MAKSSFSEDQLNELVAIVNKIAERFIEAANAYTERVVAETIVRERERVARIVERVEPITGFQDGDVTGAKPELPDLKAILAALGEAIRASRQ
jgi:hypothetical protein